MIYATQYLIFHDMSMLKTLQLGPQRMHSDVVNIANWESMMTK